MNNDTIIGQLLQLPGGYSEKAVINAYQQKTEDELRYLRVKCGSTSRAVMGAFAWCEAVEGPQFWVDVHDLLAANKPLPKIRRNKKEIWKMYQIVKKLNQHK